MIEIVQAFDRAPISSRKAEDLQALESTLQLTEKGERRTHFPNGRDAAWLSFWTIEAFNIDARQVTAASSEGSSKSR